MAGETEPSRRPAVLTVVTGVKPDTTASELSRLAQDAGTEIRAQVAAHPNTPAELLGRLAAEFPAEVMGNPALPLLRLAHPNLLKDWPKAALLALLKLPQAPDWLRRHAAKSSSVEVQVALATHPDLSPAEVAALARHPAWLVRARIAARKDVGAELLGAFALDPDYGVRLAAALRQDLPAHAAETLRRDPSRFVRQVAEHPRRFPGGSPLPTHHKKPPTT